MKLSVMLFPFQGEISDGRLTGRHLAEQLQACGASGVEPMLSCLDAAPDQWQPFMDAVKDLGLQHTCLDIGANLVGENEADRKQAMETVKRGLDLCAELSCPIALIPGSKPATGMANEEGRKIYAEGLAQAVTLAAPLSITVCIEDFGVYPLFACHSSHVLEVVTLAGPEVKVAWDNGNFILADEMPMDALPPLWERICHVHIKDFVLVPTGQAGIKTPSGKTYQSSPIGEGNCQVAECVGELKRRGYDGWVSVEVGLAPPLEDAIKGAAAVKQAWGD